MRFSTISTVLTLVCAAEFMAPGYGYDRKSGTVAALLSVLVTGAGQMYAGKVNEGVVLLLTGIASGVGAVVAIGQLDRSANYGESNDAMAETAIGLVGVDLGLYIYSIASANGDVHQYNLECHPVPVLSPAIQQRAGRADLGLALRF